MSKLFKSIPIHSLIVTRIFFGLIMFWEVCRYFAYGWIDRKYIQPEFHFKYYGFEWVEVLPGQGMYVLFGVLGVLALCILLGLFYRIASLLFTLLFTYVFLLDQAQYLNHFYMVILMSALLSCMPANRYWSLDALIWPQIKSSVIPFWPVFLLRAQMEIILVYAGLVKINPDWLLNLQPLKNWIYQDRDLFLLGPLFTQDWAVMVAAWGVVGLHLIGAPLLLVRQTRIYVFVIYCCFHTLNSLVFEIGIFPWMTMAMTLIFFPPDWPKNLAVRYFGMLDRRIDTGHLLEINNHRRKVIVCLLTGWLLFQVLFPTRNLLYPGYVAWTNEGHRFSWRMKLRSIKGRAHFFVRNLDNEKIHWVNSHDYLTRKQIRKMACRPDMILQFGHFLGQQWKKQGDQNIQVGVYANCSLNYRPKKALVDPTIDLLQQPRSLYKAQWLLPFSGKTSPSFF